VCVCVCVCVCAHGSITLLLLVVVFIHEIIQRMSRDTFNRSMTDGRILSPSVSAHARVSVRDDCIVM